MIRCPLVLERLELDEATGEVLYRARLTWAALIKKIYEIDPLLCPFCGSQMKIVAFITEYPTVCHILEHIQMPAQRPEPPGSFPATSGRAAVRLRIYRAAAPLSRPLPMPRP